MAKAQRQPVRFARVLFFVFGLMLAFLLAAISLIGMESEHIVESMINVHVEKLREEQAVILQNIYYTSRNVLGNVMYDSEINRILKNTKTMDVQAIRTMRDKLRMAQNLHLNDIEYRVVLLDFNGNMYANWLRGAGYYEEIFRKDEVQDALEEGNSFFVMKHPFWYRDDELPASVVSTISFGNVVLDQYLSNAIGIMLFSVEEESLVDTLEESGQVAVTNTRSGERLCGRMDEALYQYVQENGERFPEGTTVQMDWEGRRLLICRSAIASSGIELLQVMAFDEMYSRLISVKRLNIVLLMMGMALMAVLAIFTAKWVAGPLHGIYQQVCALNIDEKGQISRITSHGYRECVEVADAVNDMSERMMEMIELNKRQQRDRAELKYRYLISQLDPHFLLNTLNNIKWTAYMNHDPRVAEMVMALGFLLETSLGKNHGEVTVGYEISHVRNYMLLQSMHYGENVTCEIISDEAVRRLPFERFTLITLVGNAIKHGYVKSGKLHIRVSACSEDGWLIIGVQDDGQGMTPERLEQVHLELRESESGERSSHIGLRNLCQRLAYRFEGRADMRISSELGKGTSVTIRVPMECFEEGGKGTDV